ncbi:hypothetical protein PHISP_03762 [Aspergillus sp. HF37]|nr:hypothetical protein PHISP_03762 [Aspergillus sp. HF37]
MTKPSHIELPPGVQLVYLAEGGANVVYRFASASFGLHGAVPAAPPDTDNHLGIPPALRGKLLRLRKETSSAIPYQDVARNFDRSIRPLFHPDELVDQALTCLSKGLVQRCNEQLRAAELTGTRPRSRQGVYLSVAEPFGLLVTDMTALGDPGSVVAELKPKWLLQSPSAPPNARRCRTCALRDMKNHKLRALAAPEEHSFCPLDLMSDRFDTVLRATGLVKGCMDRGRLARVLYRNPALQTLQLHQKAFGDVGLYGPSPQSRDKSMAMTLRDCTMFIRIPRDEGSPVEVRFGDLDLKTGAGGKAQYWLDLETRLINEGWYSGANLDQQPVICAVQDSRRHSHPLI